MEPFDPVPLDHIWQASLGHQTWDGLNVLQTVRPPVEPYVEVEAVKVIRRGSESQPAAHFAHEARINAGLNHPNILPVHGRFQSNSQPALGMKRVWGRSWTEQLREDRQRLRDTLAEHVGILWRVCAAEYPEAAEVFANLAAIRTERYGQDSLEVASALNNLAPTPLETPSTSCRS